MHCRCHAKEAVSEGSLDARRESPGEAGGASAPEPPTASPPPSPDRWSPHATRRAIGRGPGELLVIRGGRGRGQGRGPWRQRQRQRANGQRPKAKGKAHRPTLLAEGRRPRANGQGPRAKGQGPRTKPRATFMAKGQGRGPGHGLGRFSLGHGLQPWLKATAMGVRGLVCR